jgi:hypothetical protein
MRARSPPINAELETESILGVWWGGGGDVYEEWIRKKPHCL